MEENNYIRRADTRMVEGASYAMLEHLSNKTPYMFNLLNTMKDPRNKSYITYDQKTLIGQATIMHLLKYNSMHMMTRRFNNENVIKNICKFLNVDYEELAHGDTINRYLEKLDFEELQKVIWEICRRMIKFKKWDKYRVNGKFIIAIDGTEIYTSKTRHCDSCLVRTTTNGKKEYYHKVLEAKLILDDMVISIGSEFIENLEENATKQDCELKAFRKLIARIKKAFPKQHFIIIGDALFARESVFEQCKEEGWNFVIRFKEGVSKPKYEDFLFSKQPCRELNYSNKIYLSKDKYKKLEKKDDSSALSMVGSEEMYEDEESNKSEKWMFITDIKLSDENVKEIYKIGRQRWEIENQGFNVQKNMGYELEHMFSRERNAMKNHYLIIQIAHLIEQMILKYHQTKIQIGERIKKLWESAKSFSEDLIITLSQSNTKDILAIKKDCVKGKLQIFIS